jgi:hypothetical protein
MLKKIFQVFLKLFWFQISIQIFRSVATIQRSPPTCMLQTFVFSEGISYHEQVREGIEASLHEGQVHEPFDRAAVVDIFR